MDQTNISVATPTVAKKSPIVVYISIPIIIISVVLRLLVLFFLATALDTSVLPEISILYKAIVVAQSIAVLGLFSLRRVALYAISVTEIVWFGDVMFYHNNFATALFESVVILAIVIAWFHRKDFT